MKIKVIRHAFKDSYTIGKLYINDVYYCDTLEDKVRDLTKEKKVPGETAIPTGTYEVYYTYSNRLGKYYPRINDVPQFTGILMHAGNTAVDTEGCILIGKNKVAGGLIESQATLTELRKKMLEAITNMERLEITIENQR